MPPVPSQPAFVTRSASSAYDPASASDDEDDAASRSTWASSNPDATILGFADGPAPADLDWRTSRIGGIPTFPALETRPSPSVALCKLCSSPIPLLAQIYCPLDSSALERVVYVFACTRRSCRGKNGSVRAYRASVPWIEEQNAVIVPEVKHVAVQDLGSLVFGGGAANAKLPENPFAAPSAGTSNPFAPPALNPFVTQPLAPSLPPSPSPTAAGPLADLSASLAKATLSPKVRRRSATPEPWPVSTPRYPAQYVTTAYESTSPTPSVATSQLVESMMDLDEGKHREGKGKGGRAQKPTSSAAGGDAWGKEGYEVQRVRGVDDVFLRFQERVSRDGCGSQVVRYNHSSVPLPFSSHSALYRRLFPSPSEEDEGEYTPERLPPCSTCGMPTAFEYQLMPALVGVLNKLGLESAADEPEVAKPAAPSVADVEGQHALDFATAMVFSCLGECVDETSREAWREEVVMLEIEE